MFSPAPQSGADDLSGRRQTVNHRRDQRRCLTEYIAFKLPDGVVAVRHERPQVVG